MIRGKKRPINSEVKQLNSEAKFNIHNRFDIEVVDSTTGVIKQKAYAENIVLDSLWTRLLAPNTYFNYIHFGTGAGTTEPSRNTLFAFLGRKQCSQDPSIQRNVNEGWCSFRKSIQISEFEYVGSIISEVGIGYGSASNTLVTHAMIKDMNGNTITIAKTDVDIINIYATVFIHFSTSGYGDGEITIIADSYGDYFFKFLSGHSILITSKCFVSTGSLYMTPCARDAVDGTPWLSSVGSTCQVYTPIITFAPATKSITMSLNRISVNNGNIGGIRMLCFSWYGQSEYLSGLPGSYLLRPQPFISIKPGNSWTAGSTITGEGIGTGDGIEKDFKTGFGFAKDIVVYVNGAPQTNGVIIDPEAPFEISQMGQYFERMYDEKNINWQIFPMKNTNSYVEFGTSPTNIYYNPFFTYGITEYYVYRVGVSVSDDLENWVELNSLQSTAITVQVPAIYQYSKYWKATANAYKTSAWHSLKTSGVQAKNIHFDTPPEDGAVITADYVTECIAKDENHVFDFSLTITLGEKTV